MSTENTRRLSSLSFSPESKAPAPRSASPPRPWAGQGRAGRLPFLKACKFQVTLFRPVRGDDATQLQRKWAGPSDYKLENVTSPRSVLHIPRNVLWLKRGRMAPCSPGFQRISRCTPDGRVGSVSPPPHVWELRRPRGAVETGPVDTAQLSQSWNEGVRGPPCTHATP